MALKRFAWDMGKNLKLKLERGVSFEDVYLRIQNGAYHTKKNPSKNHKGQRLFLVTINGKLYAVPFTEFEDHFFLRTIYEIRL